MKIRRSRIGRNSIKESFDNLPVGLCYFNPSGLPILVNRKMDQLVYEMIGRDLQLESELTEALSSLEDDLFISKDHRIWRFSCSALPDVGNEYLAADITEIHRDHQLLMEKNRQLKDVNAAIEEIGRNYVAIAREEELLSMKMRIHNEMGRCGLAIQKFYQDGCKQEEKRNLIQQIQNAVALLKGEIGKSDEEDTLEELLNTAHSIGASIKLIGKMPSDHELRNLLVLSMRECLMNTLRHAGGDTLFVELYQNADWFRAEIRNNGRLPAGPIVEGGGLSSLRKKIERFGGRMEVFSEPHYCLKVYLPVKEQL